MRSVNVRYIAIAVLLLSSAPAWSFSYATGGCATGGCGEGEDWLYTNANEVDAALDAVESIVADGDKGDITLSSSGAVWNIDTGAVGANEIADNSIGAGDIGPNAVANSEMGDDAIGPAEMADADHGDVAWSGGVASVQAGTATTAGALAANGANCSAGNFPLGVDASGAAEGCEDAATQAELDAKSAASSTDNAVPKFDSTAGDVQNSGVLIDDSNNMTVPGTLTTGGSEVPTCLILRDSDDAGNSACAVLNGTFSCETDTNGVCGDAT